MLLDAGSPTAGPRWQTTYHKLRPKVNGQVRLRNLTMRDFLHLQLQLHTLKIPRFVGIIPKNLLAIFCGCGYTSKQ
jgi:hypothetical protein